MLNYNQIVSIVSDDEQLEGLLNLPQSVLRTMFGGEFAAMYGFNQRNPHHCYNLLEHTIRAALAIPFNRDECDCVNLRIAALFHDIAKPLVAREKNGRLVFYGHAEKSVGIAEKILDAAGVPDETAVKIIFYIREHDTLIPFYAEGFCARNASQKKVTEENIAQMTKSENETFRKKYGYSPVTDDWYNLTFMVAADGEAQSEIAIINGKVSGTKEEKKAVAYAARKIFGNK